MCKQWWFLPDLQLSTRSSSKTTTKERGILPTESLCTCGRMARFVKTKTAFKFISVNKQIYKIHMKEMTVTHHTSHITHIIPYLFLYLDFLVVLTSSRHWSSRQTRETVWITARICAGHQAGKGIELVKICLYCANMTTLCAKVFPFTVEDLEDVKKAMIQHTQKGQSVLTIVTSKVVTVLM